MSGDRRRLQLDLGEKGIARLDALVARTGSSTRAEVVRRALEVYELLLSVQDEGTRIVVQGPGTLSRDVLLPLPFDR